MSILDIQRGIAEAGRIRIGVKEPVGNGRSRPAKIDSFRLTSADKVRIEQAAQLWGGQVKAWQAPAGPQWEVITEATALDVVVPPAAMAFSQWYELWSAGGCQRRCDGQTESLSEGECLCDPANRACDSHTRLSVMLRDLPGLALWRIDTQGYYAARELAGAVEVLTMAAGRGVMLPARLILDQRVVKRIEDGKSKTYRFAVPRLDVGVTPGELLLALPSGGQSLPELVEGERPKLLPVPDSDPFVPTIAEQSAAPAARTKRANAAPEIPASGRSRSAAKQAGDPGYWRARTFAEAQEHGVDNSALRALAARMVDDPDEESFSMSTLDETAWERLHGVVLALKPVAADEAAQVIVEADAWTPAEAPAAPTGSIIDRLRELTRTSELEGDMSVEQRGDVFRRVIQPVGSKTFHTVFVTAFDQAAFASPSAAQADALLSIAASFPDQDAHADAWQELADELDAAVPA